MPKIAEVSANLGGSASILDFLAMFGDFGNFLIRVNQRYQCYQWQGFGFL
jgi:hypothetical protein